MESQKSSYEKIVRESLLNEYQYLFEGIDINTDKLQVSFNASHEENINTSDIINPTYYKVRGINVISIFKRKKADEHKLDGNPLIYALKGLYGWKFKNQKEDIINLFKQFIKICRKLNIELEEKYDTIITIPSNNELNINFLHKLNNVIKCDFEITNYFHKLMSDIVYNEHIDWLKIGKIHNEEYKQHIKNELNNAFNNMEKYNKGYFSFKFIKNTQLRKYITNTMFSYPDDVIKYASQINDKRILILDDTIGSGASISEAVKKIQDTFTPKDITVITLFSKL